MIVQLKGKVKFPITLDPTVWIFDDRKIALKDAFIEKKNSDQLDDAEKTAEMFDQEVYFQTKIKPPVKKSIKKFDREKILSESYVMPLKPFIEHSHVSGQATKARLITDADDIIITLEQLLQSLALFSLEGKPLKEDGPIHLFFGDGSNRENPFKAIKQIVIE